MSDCLYVFAAEPHSGKAVVAQGVLEALARRYPRVAVFRPVAFPTGADDGVITSALSRHPLPIPPEDLSGCSLSDFQQAGREGRLDQLVQHILDRYHALEDTVDFILVVGTDLTEVAEGVGFDFNARLAANLGAPVLHLVTAIDRTPEAIATAARIHGDALLGQDVQVVATVANRVPAELVDDTRAALKSLGSHAGFIGVLPELADLAAPTVGEAAQALDARILAGSEVRLSRSILHVRVGAMEVADMLSRIVDETLLITAADRADAILGAVAAGQSKAGPQIVGLVLTGGFDPHPKVLDIVRGSTSDPPPMLTVSGDTLQTAKAILEIRPRLASAGSRKIQQAIRAVDQHLDLDELLDQVVETDIRVVTPALFEYQLIRRARAARKRIVLPEGTDPRILEAAGRLRDREVAQLILLGDVDLITRKALELGISLDGLTLIDPDTSDLRSDFAKELHRLRAHRGLTEEAAWDQVTDVSYFGTLMVHLGHADGMVSGAMHSTAHTIRPALQILKTAPGSSIVSSVFLMALADRVLIYGDCAVIPDPNPEELASIALDAAATARRFHIEPRVAMLSYSTGSSGSGAQVDKVREATRIARERAPDLPIEGPIQYDAAIDAGVARTKLPDSQVAGRATVFIFPDLNTGNNTYKAVQRSSGAVAIGPVLQGLAKPVNDLSRGCTVPDIINTVAITAVQAAEEEA